MTDDNERDWFKSSYSGPNNNSCVEARFAPDGIDIRDSKDPDGPILRFDRTTWTKFVRRLA
ncbi:hypothetical protein GCM10011581_18400 [Saccharopolyspora subtropica]|uniref:DUF397 domain-containing protein n=2 Tax=Saccharopolyspora thermophila TaxID=89367 RepID=A0A917JQD5_9PSEU|nr:hypothetical protein GCM10011581_18400 [Saccharopolyspora subtropica]